MSRAVLSFAGAAAYCAFKLNLILDEPKRRFYAEETEVFTVPGIAGQEDTQLLGPRTEVNGMIIRLNSVVESGFSAVRTALLDVLGAVEAHVNDSKTVLYEKERQVSATVEGLHHRSEELVPNAAYIAIAFLTGQIAARNRGFVAKAVLPVGLGLGAFKYFLPQTFSRTADFVWKAEQRAFPALASTQGAAVEKTNELAHTLDESATRCLEQLSSSVEALRKKVIRLTGLNSSEDVTDKST